MIFFQNSLKYFWDTCILQILFCIENINKFQGDLTDISAWTKSLLLGLDVPWWIAATCFCGDGLQTNCYNGNVTPWYVGFSIASYHWYVPLAQNRHTEIWVLDTSAVAQPVWVVGSSMPFCPRVVLKSWLRILLLLFAFMAPLVMRAVQRHGLSRSNGANSIRLIRSQIWPTPLIG